MVRLFPRATPSPAQIGARGDEPHINVSPADPIGFYPPPRNLLTPPPLRNGAEGNFQGGVPNRGVGTNNNPSEFYSNAGYAPTLGATGSFPFSTDDSPRRRRITRQILGHLASPSVSETPIGYNFSPLGLLPDKPQHQEHHQLDLLCPYRNAAPGAIMTTAAHSPFLHSQTTAIVGASPPFSGTGANAPLRTMLGGEGVGTGTPNPFCSANDEKISSDNDIRYSSYSSHRRSGGRRRRRSSQVKRRRSSGMSESMGKRPRPHSIDPAGRDIPMRGKKIFTYALTMISVFLMLQSLIAGGGFAPLSVNPMLGPSAETLLDMGGLVTELVREGEWWRIVWSPFLHAGIFHLLLNIVLWVPIGSLAEPDWGVLRTTGIFVVGAITGNLLSACLDPFSVSVGSSGGIFAVMAAFVPYVIEFWHSIPRAKCLLVLVALTVLVGVGTSFIPYVDVYAHLGGVVGGLLAGFATITKWQAFTLSQPHDRYRYPQIRSNSQIRFQMSKLESALEKERRENITPPPAARKPSLKYSGPATGVDTMMAMGHGSSTDVASHTGTESDVCGSGVTPPPNYNPDLCDSDLEKPVGVVASAHHEPVSTAVGERQGGTLSSSKSDEMTDGQIVGGNGILEKGQSGEDGSCYGTACTGTSGELAAVGEIRPPRRASRTSFAGVPSPSPKAQPRRSVGMVGNEVQGPADRGRKRSFRATLNPVNDRYGCTARIWAVRVTALLLLFAVWFPLVYLIFICPECYSPPGQVIQLRNAGRRLVFGGDVFPDKFGVWGSDKAARRATQSDTAHRQAYRYYEIQLRRQLLRLRETL